MILYKYILIFITIPIIIIGQSESALEEEDEFELTQKNAAVPGTLRKKLYIGLEDTEVINDSLFNFPDVNHFLTFDIIQFDTLNQECFLAFLGYVKLELMDITNDEKKMKTSKTLFMYLLRVIRVLDINFKKNFGSELWELYQTFYDWMQDPADTKKVGKINTCKLKAQTIFEKHRQNKELWKSKKASQLLNEINSRNKSQKVFTKMAYKYCEKNLRGISSISVSYEQELIKNQATKTTLDSDDSEDDDQDQGFKYLPAISNTWGTLLLLLTNEHFSNLMIFPEDIESQREYLVYEVMRPALEDIFRGIIHILKDIELSEYDIVEPIDFRGNIRVNVELLIILKHLYKKVIDVVEEIHFYFVTKQTQAAFVPKRKVYNHDYMGLYYNYEAYKQLFQIEWTRIFQSLKSVPGIDLFYKQLFQVNLDAKFSYENLKQLELVPSMSFDKLYRGVLIKGRRVQPSIIRYTAASNVSWADPVHHETNTNQSKVMLLEFNMWLSIILSNGFYFLERALTETSLRRNYSEKQIVNINRLTYENRQEDEFENDKMFLRDRNELKPNKNINMDKILPADEIWDTSTSKP